MNHRRWFLRKIGSQNMNLGLRISLSVSVNLRLVWNISRYTWNDDDSGIGWSTIETNSPAAQSKRDNCGQISNLSLMVVCDGFYRKCALGACTGFWKFCPFARSWRTRFGENFGLFDSFLTLPIHDASNDACYNNLTLKVHQRGHSVSRISIRHKGQPCKSSQTSVNAPTTLPTSIASGFNFTIRFGINFASYFYALKLLNISIFISRLLGYFTNCVTFHLSKNYISVVLNEKSDSSVGLSYGNTRLQIFTKRFLGIKMNGCYRSFGAFA